MAAPMTPAQFAGWLLPEALALLPRKMDSREARVLITAICLQESGLEHRYQLMTSGRKGPARGLPQFEKGGGVAGVMRHSASRNYAAEVCKDREVPFNALSIWQMLEYDDILAVAFARLLLWTDPGPLPADEQGAWELYAERTWRPGKPHRDRWTRNWAAAVEAVK